MIEIDFFPIIIMYFVFINFIGIVLMRMDKKRAISGAWRISERLLIVIAILGGALGMLVASKKYRHKTKKKLFSIGLPFILLVHLLLIFFQYYR